MPAPEATPTAVATRRATFDRVKRSVVALALLHPDRGGEQSVPPREWAQEIVIVGTGFVIGSDGVVATAAHVIDRVRQEMLTAESRGKRPPGTAVLLRTFLGIDPADGLFTQQWQPCPIRASRTWRPGDFATVEFELPPGVPSVEALELSPYPCAEGDRVALCGFPYGLRLHGGTTCNASFASGTVSAIVPSANTPPALRKSVQLDVSVLPGTSGGPVFDPETGAVVGIVTNNYRDPLVVPTARGDVLVDVLLSLSFAEDITPLRLLREGGYEAGEGSGEWFTISQDGVVAEAEES